MSYFKKISSFLFLVALLFALSGKTIHVLSENGHEHDFICSENSTHFHEQEHSCFICDFELQIVDDFNFNSFEIYSATSFELTSLSFQKYYVNSGLGSHSPRGPPTI